MLPKKGAKKCVPSAFKVTRREILGSQGRCVFDFITNCQVLNIVVSFSHQPLLYESYGYSSYVYVDLLNCSHFCGCVVVSRGLLMTSDVEYLLICLVAILVSYKVSV